MRARIRVRARIGDGLEKWKNHMMDMRLELVPLRTTDVDRSKAFYIDQVGFILDHDAEPGNGVRVVQLTPPGSSCSVVFGVGISNPDDAPAHGLHLVVDDIAAVRHTLLAKGVEVSAIDEMGGGVSHSYFSDPDGNSWVLQQLAGRGVRAR